eukprot:TRINITY_DN1583_c0_g1_i1.p1 TRINITY_DN1583_c0_g1~~TRINITY_DN1583_c0_g1_i1.p1  ORF type:complete len:238 (-),score=29.58 TRINITY_DN1583_c0_g1_i1:42-722(-)
MDSAVGFLIEGGVILLSDQSAGHSVLSVTRDEDRILTIWPGARDGTANTITAMACQGDDADRENVAKYLIRNVILHNMRTGLELSVQSTASFMRTELARMIRESPANINLLVGGVDNTVNADQSKSVQSMLYLVDYMGSMRPVQFAAHGYGSLFVTALLDRHWMPHLNMEQGLNLARMCIAEIQKRIVINSPSYTIKAITSDGIKILQKVSSDPRMQGKELEEMAE